MAAAPKKAVRFQDPQDIFAATVRAAAARKRADEKDAECPCLLLTPRARGEAAEAARPEEAALQLPISTRAIVQQVARPLRRQGSRLLEERSHVIVVGPGAGTGQNGKVYMDLEHDLKLRVEIVGRSHAAYDCYPESWPQGRRAPNLQSFATSELLATGAVSRTDCLVVGSRGGQVVLPILWQTLSASVPPAVILNGGCAMDLPRPVFWPEGAVSFLLLGGRDDMFKRQKGRLLTPKEYLADAQRHVPAQNKTTAILFVNEMVHMPQSRLLSAALRPMINAVLSWKSTGNIPIAEFDVIHKAMLRDQWSGTLLYTQDAGIWEEMEFGSGVDSPQPPALKRAGTVPPMKLAAQAATPATSPRVLASARPSAAVAPTQAAVSWPVRAATAALQRSQVARAPAAAATVPSASVASGRFARRFQTMNGVAR